MAFITQLPTKPGLGELLGAGFTKGMETGLTQLLKQRTKGIGLTPYQAISSQLRAKEQTRKIESGVTQSLLKLSEEDVVAPQDIIPISRNVTGMIRKGMAPGQALEEGVSNYQFQQSAMDEAKIPKFSARKAGPLKEEIYSKLKEGDITNATLINRELKAKKWPTKERQNILKSMRTIRREEPKEAVKEEPKKAKAVTEKMPSPVGKKGKFLRETETGKRYRSDGKKWIEVK